MAFRYEITNSKPKNKVQTNIDKMATLWLSYVLVGKTASGMGRKCVVSLFTRPTQCGRCSPGSRKIAFFTYDYLIKRLLFYYNENITYSDFFFNYEKNYLNYLKNFHDWDLIYQVSRIGLFHTYIFISKRQNFGKFLK